MENKSLGELVKYYRKSRKMSQEELGALCGYKSGKTAISKIERGVNDANTATIQKIAEALNVSPLLFLEPFTADNLSEFHEYLPYLADASEETLRTIRFMLHMPEKKTASSSDSIKTIS